MRPLRTDSLPNYRPLDFFEIVLGGWSNTKSVIRFTQSETELAVYEGSICSMNDWVVVTVAWEDGRIMVSMGETPGENIFMEYTDSELRAVHWVGVMTGWGAEGNWLWD